METYKSFHCINANCLHGVFKFNSTSHERRSNKLIQPKRRTTSNDLRSFSYPGSKLWNDLVNSDPAIANCDFNEIMDYLKQSEGSDMNDSFPYVWIFMILNVLYFIAWIVFLILNEFLFPLCFMYISPLDCKYSAPSRILAFWLVLYVLRTTLTKAI